VLDFCRVFSPQSPVYSHHMLFSRWSNPTAWDTHRVTAVSQDNTLLVQKLDWTKQSPPPQPVNNKAFSALIFAGHRAPLYTSIRWVPTGTKLSKHSALPSSSAVAELERSGPPLMDFTEIDQMDPMITKEL
jgi:hypothetical protein